MKLLHYCTAVRNGGELNYCTIVLQVTNGGWGNEITEVLFCSLEMGEGSNEISAQLY